MNKIYIPLVLLFYCTISYAQNVGIGTLTPVAKLHIKGSSDASQLVIDANATQSNTSPLLRLRSADGTDVLHIHSDHISNTFIGLDAGRANKILSQAFRNTFIGSGAGYSNIAGYGNSANGYQALYSNTTGVGNTASGVQALYSNTTGNANTANGAAALLANSTGVGNTANGLYALTANTLGDNNTANGGSALAANTSGNNNTANGVNALAANSTGDNNTADGASALANTAASFYNTALGFQAGYKFNNGYNNVFLGANADVNSPDLFNVIAIGRNSVCTAPSQVTIGNSSTVSYRAYAGWSNISDGRFKKNIQGNVPGLDFINQLRPVTYNINASGLDAFLRTSGSKATGQLNEQKVTPPNDAAAKAIDNKALLEKEKVVYTGFVAQEVETTAKKLGFNFSGVDAPANASDVYGLRYAEFVVPLVKAVQEQQLIIKDLQKQIDELKALNKK